MCFSQVAQYLLLVFHNPHSGTTAALQKQAPGIVLFSALFLYVLIYCLKQK